MAAHPNRIGASLRRWAPIQPGGGIHAYIVAILLVAAAFGVRRILDPWIGVQAPYLQFYPAIMVAAWYGGFGPGALATALSTVVAMQFFLPPDGFAIDAATEGVSLAFFGGTGLTIAALNQRLRNSERAYRAEAQLGTARATRLDTIINTTVDGIIVINAGGIVEEFNRGAEQLFGYRADEVIGRNVKMLMPSPYHDQHDRYLERYLDTGEAQIIGTGRQVTARRRDGTTFPVHLSVGEMRMGDQRKFTGMIHDLSKRVQLEERLREQAALANLGEMAAVVAHEVKNPLAGIRGAVQVIAGRTRDNATESRVLAEIISRIDSLDRMMKELLLFARPSQLTLVPTDVTELITATAWFLSQDPALQDIDLQIVGSAPPVRADGEMLKIVFQNLLINGAHAMHGKGRIRVTIHATDGVCDVTFADGGPGIPPDILEKVFTPFFTTKSRGSGLGLPTAKRIVEAHNGAITIDCPPGGGTTVVVRLPIAPRKSAA